MSGGGGSLCAGGIRLRAGAGPGPRNHLRLTFGVPVEAELEEALAAGPGRSRAWTRQVLRAVTRPEVSAKFAGTIASASTKAGPAMHRGG